MLEEIDRLSQTNPEEMPESSRYRFEIDLSTVEDASGEAQLLDSGYEGSNGGRPPYHGSVSGSKNEGATR